QTVIGRAQITRVDAVGVNRRVNRAKQKTIKALKIYRPAAVVVCLKIILIVDELSARANTVLATRERKHINQSGRRLAVSRVDVRARISDRDCVRSHGSDAN